MHLVRANAEVSQPKNYVQWVSTNAPHNNISYIRNLVQRVRTYAQGQKSTSNFEKYENAFNDLIKFIFFF